MTVKSDLLAANLIRRPGISKNAQVVLDRRYLKKEDGVVIENADAMFQRVAGNLSKAIIKNGGSESRRQEAEDAFYRVMRDLDFVPNSPTLMNAGRELQQLSACFVLPVEDSIEDIFTRVKQTALIHKSGGGTGFAFSRLRPNGDEVKSTSGIASGPVTFIEAFDAATEVVKQGGTRRGANMAVLDVRHPDVMEFIESKLEGDLSNFNISVGISERFMEAVLADEDWVFVNPRTGQEVDSQPAVEIFDAIIQAAWKTGDPGLVFLDRINADNPNKQLGTIESTNPCGEQPLLPFESCNLGSLNLAQMVLEGEIDWDHMIDVIKVGVQMLDCVVDMNEYPLPEIAEMSLKTRRIGFGVMGWADMLIQLGIRYDSDEAVELAEKVMRFIQGMVFEMSGRLARLYGNFPAWAHSDYGKIDCPMRNSAPTTIAPTGTISIIAGASSGIEPLFALAYVRNVMDNDRLIESNKYLAAVLKQRGLYTEDIMAKVITTGTIQHLDIPDDIKDVFRTSHDISPEWHVRMQAAFQKYTDNAVSKTINFPELAEPVDIRTAYMLAYQLNCKGITVYRDGSKLDQVLSMEKEVHDILPFELKERPRITYGFTERVNTAAGNLYITVNLDEDSQPFEVFGRIGKQDPSTGAWLEALSRVISLALRSGTPPDNIITQLEGITDVPVWDEGAQVKSGPDAIAKVLKRIMTPSADERVSVRCPECGQSATMQEGCIVCHHCGYSECG